MKEDFSDIAAYRNNACLGVMDWVTIFPVLRYYQWKTTRSLKLEYLGDRKQIEADIRNGASFLTNHRDIVMDAAWLSLLLRTRHGIRPYMGMGDNLFGKWWIEGLARFEHVYVVKRSVSPHELIRKSQHLSRYLRGIRKQNHSLWLAEREGRSKDSNDRAQGSVLKMLTMAHIEEGMSFFDAIRELNICPVSISYEYDPCDYLKAEEMQLKRDNPRWRKRPQDDIKSMKTGIQGQKGRVVFRLTPSINHRLERLLAERPELKTAAINDQAQAVCDLIDQQIWLGYETYDHFDREGHPTPQFEEYIRSRVALVRIADKDEQYLHDRIVEMYKNPIINHDSAVRREL